MKWVKMHVPDELNRTIKDVADRAGVSVSVAYAALANAMVEIYGSAYLPGVVSANAPQVEGDAFVEPERPLSGEGD